MKLDDTRSVETSVYGCFRVIGCIIKKQVVCIERKVIAEIPQMVMCECSGYFTIVVILILHGCLMELDGIMVEAYRVEAQGILRAQNAYFGTCISLDITQKVELVERSIQV